MPAGLPDHQSSDALALESFHTAGSLAAASGASSHVRSRPRRDLCVQYALYHGLRVREQELALLAAVQVTLFEAGLVGFGGLEVRRRLENLDTEYVRLVHGNRILGEKVQAVLRRERFHGLLGENDLAVEQDQPRLVLLFGPKLAICGRVKHLHEGNLRKWHELSSDSEDSHW